MLGPSPYRNAPPEPEAGQPYWNALAEVLVAGTSRPAIEAVLAQLGRADAAIEPFYEEPGPSMLHRALLERLNRKLA